MYRKQINKVKTKIKELNGSMNEQLKLIREDSKNIIKILKLTSEEVDFLVDKNLKIATNACTILFVNHNPLGGDWRNYAFIAPNKQFISNDFKMINNDYFKKESKNRASWICCVNKAMKKEVFKDLKNDNYTVY